MRLADVGFPVIYRREYGTLINDGDSWWYGTPHTNHHKNTVNFDVAQMKLGNKAKTERGTNAADNAVKYHGKAIYNPPVTEVVNTECNRVY